MKLLTAKTPVILSKQARMTTHLEANGISTSAIFQLIENGDIARIAQNYVLQLSTEVCPITVVLSLPVIRACGERKCILTY